MNTMATHQTPHFLHREQLYHGGCGEDDVRLQNALMLNLNASCLAETHKSFTLSQTTPSKVSSFVFSQRTPCKDKGCLDDLQVEAILVKS